VLALPAATRRALSVVPGPGWRIYDNTSSGTPDCYIRTDSEGRPPSDLTAWWPANPAAAVRAVLRIPPWDAHRRIYEACTRDEGDDGDDHAAALWVIEGHVRGLLSAMPSR
jgi:hypothetical protein